MTERVLALIDGNSFYCSCERVFDGRLAKRPVIVLSNNDGCAIARTAEAKALGIGMGAPYFMIRDLCRREGVAVFSSNYALYGDMSARMNEVYRSFSPDVEIYSIDESFLDLTGFTRRDLVAYARDLRERVRKWIGIPTCVGLARQSMTVVGERLIYELRGISCINLETVPAAQKGCAVTRMFSSRVESLPVMEQAIASHATQLGEKLRRQALGTDHVSIFYHTSEHDRGEPQRSVSTTVSLPEATNESLALAKAATWGARRLWRDGYRYSKAGVMTFDLVKLAASQRALFDGFDRERSAALMGAMDTCNRRFGRGTVVPAAANVERRRSWSTKFQMRTPRYTTCIDELPAVKG